MEHIKLYTITYCIECLKINQQMVFHGELNVPFLVEGDRSIALDNM
ncbi:hypothetical protein [Bacillus sp. Cs-700]|nr:hypothetical protein [Bacillus sp. Cs-700]